MKAFCWRHGQIGFGRKAPEGTLIIAEAPAKQLRSAIEPAARLAFDNRTLLVPGVPEASNWKHAVDAVSVFATRIKSSLALRETGRMGRA